MFTHAPTLSTICRALAAFAVLGAGLLGSQSTFAAGNHAARSALPIRLRLTASPGVADVGADEFFTLTAQRWGGPASVSLSFLSPHHGFTGKMDWERGCNCFRLAVSLARRIHPLELAKATATVHQGKGSESASATFLIRGLAANGRNFAPGGPPALTAWVSDPAPFQGEYEHYCGWVKTADGLGVTGVPVHVVAHFPGGTRKWFAGKTGASGIVCSHKSIGKTPAGKTVRVDFYARSLHARASFTPRP